MNFFRRPSSRNGEHPHRSNGIRSSSGGEYVRPGRRSREAAKEKDRTSHPHHPPDLPHHPKPPSSRTRPKAGGNGKPSSSSSRPTSGSYQHPHSATDLRDTIAALVDEFTGKLSKLETALRRDGSWIDLRGAFPSDKKEARIPFGEGEVGRLSGWVVFDLDLIRGGVPSGDSETHSRGKGGYGEEYDDELPSVSSGGYDFSRSRGGGGPVPQKQPGRGGAGPAGFARGGWEGNANAERVYREERGSIEIEEIRPPDWRSASYE
jgi:hypothetical protein